MFLEFNIIYPGKISTKAHASPNSGKLLPFVEVYKFIVQSMSTLQHILRVSVFSIVYHFYLCFNSNFVAYRNEILYCFHITIIVSVVAR